MGRSMLANAKTCFHDDLCMESTPGDHFDEKRRGSAGDAALGRQESSRRLLQPGGLLEL
jgi:hypothetical protein